MSRAPQDNPLFVRRPTKQQVTAYREAGLFRRLLEKYPEWGEEQGYLTKKERKGIFSRLFGGKSKPSDVVIDEERFVESVRRARDADAEAVRGYTGGTRRAPSRPSVRPVRISGMPSPQEGGMMGLSVPRRPSRQKDLISKLTVSAKSPETNSEAASVIADSVAGQDIAEALDSETIRVKQDENARIEAKASSRILPRVTEEQAGLGKPAKGTESATKGEVRKEDPPAKSAQGTQSKRQKTSGEYETIKGYFRKRHSGHWKLAFLKTESPAIIGLLTNLKILGRKQTYPAENPVYAEAVKKIRSGIKSFGEPVSKAYGWAEFNVATEKGNFTVVVMNGGKLSEYAKKDKMVGLALAAAAGKASTGGLQVYRTDKLLAPAGQVAGTAMREGGDGPSEGSPDGQAVPFAEELGALSSVALDTSAPDLRVGTDPGYDQVAASAAGQDAAPADDEAAAAQATKKKATKKKATKKKATKKKATKKKAPAAPPAAEEAGGQTAQTGRARRVPSAPRVTNSRSRKTGRMKGRR